MALLRRLYGRLKLKVDEAMVRELRALGASHQVARKNAANNRRWWRNSGKLSHSPSRCVATWSPGLSTPSRASRSRRNVPGGTGSGYGDSV
jgi:hypothetical protein